MSRYDAAHCAADQPASNLGPDVSCPPSSQPSGARAGAGDARPSSLGQRWLRLFPRRALLHRLWPGSRLGLCRPAAADAAPRLGVGRRVSLPSRLSAGSHAGGRGDRGARDGSGAPHGRRSLCPLSRGARGSSRRRAAALRRSPDNGHAPAAGLAGYCDVHHQGRTEPALAARGRRHRRPRLPCQVHSRLLPRLGRPRLAGDAPTPPACPLAAMGRRS